MDIAMKINNVTLTQDQARNALKLFADYLDEYGENFHIYGQDDSLVAEIETYWDEPTDSDYCVFTHGVFVTTGQRYNNENHPHDY